MGKEEHQSGWIHLVNDMIKLKQILQENEVDDAFGGVLFGSDHNIAKFQDMDVEKNTDDETELLWILYRWLEGGWEDTQRLLWKYYPILKKAVNAFPRILKPKTPNGTSLYRGLARLNPSLEEKLLQTDVRDWVEERGEWRYTKPIKYTPHENIQSWSVSRTIAWAFSTELGANGGILTTTQNDEFLFNQDFLGILDPKYSVELEVLHFGKEYENDVYIIVHAPVFKKIKDAYFQNN